MGCYLTSCLAFLKLGRSVPTMYSMYFTEALSFDHNHAASVPIFSTDFVVTPSHRPLLTSLPNALISDHEYSSVSGVDEGGSNGDRFIFQSSPILHRLLVFGLDGFDDGFVRARIMLFRYSSIMSSICFFVIVGLKRSIYDRSSNASVVLPRHWYVKCGMKVVLLENDFTFFVWKTRSMNSTKLLFIWVRCKNIILKSLSDFNSVRKYGIY